MLPPCRLAGLPSGTRLKVADATAATTPRLLCLRLAYRPRLLQRGRTRSRSVGGTSAGGVEHGARGERALLARHEADQGRDLPDLAEAANRDLREHEVDVLLAHLV